MQQGLGKDVLRGIYDRVARRYDWQHGFLTARSDQRGRRMPVTSLIRPGDRVLDAGAGTGSTGLLAAERVGPDGRVVLLDWSGGMLEVARAKAERAGLESRCEFHEGDLAALPFPAGTFDAVLSTYSLCPVSEPGPAALELFRVVKPGGKLGFAHSSEPKQPLIRWFAEKLERVIWRFPSLSLGCRPVAVLPALEQAGARVLWQRRIGIPLWPFLVAAVEKPAGSAGTSR